MWETQLSFVVVRLPDACGSDGADVDGDAPPSQRERLAGGFQHRHLFLSGKSVSLGMSLIALALFAEYSTKSRHRSDAAANKDYSMGCEQASAALSMVSMRCGEFLENDQRYL